MDLTVAYIAGGFSFLAAVAALLGVAWTVRSTATINNKNLFIATVTHERAKWRDDLRIVAAEFVKLSLAEIGECKVENLLRLEELMVVIRLRLNPNPRHELDASIMKNTSQIMTLLHARNMEEVRAVLGNIENSIQMLLKQEWQKSKREAIIGKLEEDDAQQCAPADRPASASLRQDGG